MDFSDKKYFKLVLGLGNCSFGEIENLCRIYALAGADIFDLSPNIKSLKAAQNGVKAAGLNPYDFKYCISFGVKGDAHIKKAKINETKCKRCYKCVSRCPQNAIVMGKNGYPAIDEAKCIGCGKCGKVRGVCIDFYDCETDIVETAKKFRGEKLDVVELHVSSLDKKTIIKSWQKIIDNFDCQKSLCIDRSKYGNLKLCKLVEKLIKMNPDKTIIQADGVPMSGAQSPASTLQAIAHAQLYSEMPVWVFISGGTNTFTGKCADLFGVRYEGVTIGSYARSAVKEHLLTGDFDAAVETAKKIVDSVKFPEEN